MSGIVLLALSSPASAEDEPPAVRMSVCTARAGPHYDAPDAVVAAVIDVARLERLPVQRSLSVALALVPGVQVSGPNGLSFRGSASDEITWMIDGIDVTDPVTGTFRPQPAGPSVPPAWRTDTRR